MSREAASKLSLPLFVLVAGMTATSLGIIPSPASGQTSGPKTFKVQLPGYPSQGYIWQYNAAESTNAQLVTVMPLGYGSPAPGQMPAEAAVAPSPERRARYRFGQRLTRQPSPPVGPRAPYEFRIAPRGTGQAILVFDYLPSGGGEPTQSHELTVNLNP